MKETSQTHCIVCIVFSSLAQSLTICAPLTKMAKDTQTWYNSSFLIHAHFRRNDHKYKGKTQNVPVPYIQRVLKQYLLV